MPLRTGLEKDEFAGVEVEDKTDEVLRNAVEAERGKGEETEERGASPRAGEGEERLGAEEEDDIFEGEEGT